MTPHRQNAAVVRHQPGAQPYADVLRSQALFGNRATSRRLAEGSVAGVHPLPIGRLATKPDSDFFSSNRSTMKAIEKAVRKDDSARAGALSGTLYASDPVFYRALLRYKLQKHAGNKAKRQLYLGGPTVDVLKDAIKLKDALLVGQLLSLVGFVPKTELITLAIGVPEFFLDSVLVPLQREPTLTDKFRELLLDNYYDSSQTYLDGTKAQDTRSEGLRGMLRDKLGAKWVAFAKTIPVLALAEESSEHFAAADTVPTTDEIVERIFDSYLKNRGINIGYFAGSKDRTEQIMMGKPGADQVTGDLGEAPPVMRTQCDDIMKILREAVRAYPALKVTFTIGMEKQALLTKPLDTLPGGLIPNTFQGNVQDAEGNWLKQIFFSGVVDTKEPNSHTWLVIGGKPYDAVLGTKGAAVAASVAGSFTQGRDMTKENDKGGGWQTVWTDGSGNRLTKLVGVVAPANAMGFSTAYRLEKPAT